MNTLFLYKFFNQILVIHVSNRNDRVVERGVDVNLGTFKLEVFCHNRYLFLPAFAGRGPFHVRALARVRCPRAGRRLACRDPRYELMSFSR